MAESSNIFFCRKFTYSARNENFRLHAALTCAQQVNHMSEKPFNSESTENSMRDKMGRWN